MVFNSRDPSSLEELEELQHSKQRSTNLNGGLENESVEVYSCSIAGLNDNVRNYAEVIYYLLANSCLLVFHRLTSHLINIHRLVYSLCATTENKAARMLHLQGMDTSSYMQHVYLLLQPCDQLTHTEVMQD